MSRLAEIAAEYNRRGHDLEPLRPGKLESLWLAFVAKVYPGAYLSMLEAFWIPAVAQESRDIISHLGNHDVGLSNRTWRWVAEGNMDAALGFADGHRLYFIGHRTNGPSQAIWILARRNKVNEIEEKVRFTIRDGDGGVAFLRDLGYQNNSFMGSVGYRSGSFFRSCAASLAEDLFEKAAGLQAP